MGDNPVAPFDRTPRGSTRALRRRIQELANDLNAKATTLEPLACIGDRIAITKRDDLREAATAVERLLDSRNWDEGSCLD